VPGSGDNDDGERAPRRGAVVPPPPDDSPESVHLPRMEPPPSSLEAMVQNHSRRRQPEAETGWWPWVVLVLVAAAITGYVMR
jgi:hypothetical protein